MQVRNAIARDGHERALALKYELEIQIFYLKRGPSFASSLVTVSGPSDQVSSQ